MRRTSFYFLLILTCCLIRPAQAQQTIPAFLTNLKSTWVDSVFNTLSPDERIAQLIMVAAYSNRGPEHNAELLKLIREQKVGGLVFFQGGPGREALLINEYQAASKVPLLMAMDAEWGVGMRLDSTISFPYQMTLGAIQDNTLLYQMGVEVGRQLRRAGILVNFAPVIDVNNNPANPVINFRSFGEVKSNVAQKGAAYMKGMQDQHILTTAKHFPGHGDTGTDSHYALPQINHGRERLDSLELYPFRELMRDGLGGVMVAHLNIPALDPSQRPSTLSKPIITNLLRNDLKFEGLIVTDAMNMKGVTASNPPGVVDKDALMAGNDVLEFTEDVPRAIAEVRKAIKAGLITQKEIDDKCRRMLAVKQWVGLNRRTPVQVSHIFEDLNTPQAHLLARKLTAASLTVLNNDRNLMPIMALDTLRIASVSFGTEKITPFQKTLGLYTAVQHFTLPNEASTIQIETVRTQLKKYNLVIGSIHEDGARPHNKLTLSVDAQDFASELSRQKNVIMAVFKNPYVLDKLKDIEQADGLIATYQDNMLAEELTAQLIFGGISASGRLPVSIGTKYKAGQGLNVQGGIRFSYTIPEDAGMNSKILYNGIDSLMAQAMNARATPGGVILVAKDKKVVMHKAYGYHDYADTVKVQLTDLYDLASVTKISTGLPSLMKLYDEKKWTLESKLSQFIPSYKRTNKGDLTMKDILTHQAGFKPFIPFWSKTVKEGGNYRRSAIRSDSSKRFAIQLNDHLYLNRKYPDKMVKGIGKSPVTAKGKYVYSDFFFMLAPRVVGSMIDQDFETYIQGNFYKPLGATTLTYNPLKKYSKKVIVPTEHDYLFRHAPVYGRVHDENAAMMGGVSGHAGLFANANDLAKLMQMYLSMGEYGGKRYISEATFKAFTRTQFPENNNRRALGFDKPNLVYAGENNNTAKGAGPESFGHTGFTGILTWMDPQTGLLYIFLSNRVNPTRDNTRLYNMNTRTKIQQVMYDALIK